jgi:hypothetical protein
MAVALGDMTQTPPLPPEWRAYPMARRRNLLADLAAEEKLLGIEQPILSLPSVVRLHTIELKEARKSASGRPMGRVREMSAVG